MSDQLWPAPAKLNLLLHITGQREDGYHTLQTVFQFLNYGDTLQISVANHATITLTGSPDSVVMTDDLVYRAAHLLQRSAHCILGADIQLQKKIPLGAGLGGGSSDAATCLVALNYLWKLNLTTPQLAEIGLQLGADVPVFIHGHAAFAEGVGEKLSAISLDEPWFLVLIPAVEVSTREIFSHPQLTRACSAFKICDLSQQQWDNVCTPIVVDLYPEVAQAIEIIGKFSPAKMSGTGASVFARFDRKVEAEQALREISLQYLPENAKLFLAQGLNVSPLHAFLNKCG